jgi:DNA-binding NarL/FixJ family response regulator
MTVRVMLVDDHRIVREGLAYMLDGIDGIDLVGEAGSGSELLAVIDQIEPDVVLLDVHMPEMSGLEALEQLRRDHPGVKVIMLSMHDQAAYVQQALRLGALGYLLKSTGLDELVRALELVADGKPYLQGELAGAVVTVDHETDLPHLSPRELDVLRLMANGRENKQIARQLQISEATVKTHVKALYLRLGVRSRAQATATALRLGLID